MKFDWKYFWISLFLITASLLAYAFSARVLYSLKAFFEIPDIDLFVGGLATIFTVTYKIKSRALKFTPAMSFNEFRIPLEDILSFIGNPITLVCSISLAKGLFMQKSEKIEYFPFYEDFELAFIGLVTAYLFFISIMEFVNNVKETLFSRPKSKEDLMPIPESEVSSEIPKPL